MIPGAVRTKHAGTGWFKPIARSWLSIQCPRRFLKIEPEPWHTSFMSRCQAVDECFFFFFRQIFLFLFFLGHLGLRRAKISGDRKKKKKRQRLGRGSSNTCAKISGSISKKIYLDCRAENMRNSRGYLVITLFQYGINFGCYRLLDIGLVKSDPRNFASCFLQTCLLIVVRRTSNRLVQANNYRTRKHKTKQVFPSSH